MTQYKFQIENGNIADGYTTIEIKDYIAEIEDTGEAVKLLIEAHGGVIVPVVKSKKKVKVVK